MKHTDALIFDIAGTFWNVSPASARDGNLGLAKLNPDKKVSAEQLEMAAGHPFGSV